MMDGRTRTGPLKILNERMRLTGAVMLRERVLEIIDDFGVEYVRNLDRDCDRGLPGLPQRLARRSFPLPDRSGRAGRLRGDGTCHLWGQGPRTLIAVVAAFGAVVAIDGGTVKLDSVLSDGRLKAAKAADGRWRSTRAWVDEYVAGRYKRG